MKVYSIPAIGTDGNQYSIRLLHEPLELRGLQRAGLVPLNVAEVVGMQDVGDSLVATLERDVLLASGGALQ